MQNETIVEIEWRDVAGYEGCYQVSNTGEVRSLARTVPGPRGMEFRIPERILRQCSHYRGYAIVFLSKENRDEKFFVHRLVASAFLPNPEGKPIVNHKDFVKTNNVVSNLEWVDAKENREHYDASLPDEPF